MRSAGVSTNTISQISSSGKGGWFIRVSKRQYPSLRHGEDQGKLVFKDKIKPIISFRISNKTPINSLTPIIF